MFVDARGKDRLEKKIIFLFSLRISVLFGLHLSSSCWVCFPFLPYFFLLAICVSHCFPDLCDYFICFLMSLSSAALLPTRLRAFTLFSILFPLSPLPYLIFSPPPFYHLSLFTFSLSFFFVCFFDMPSFISWIKSFSRFFSFLASYFARFLSSLCLSSVPFSSSSFLPSHATYPGSPPRFLCGVEAAWPPADRQISQKLLVTQHRKKMSYLREAGAWGASRSQAENGAATEEKEEVFNGMEIK